MTCQSGSLYVKNVPQDNLKMRLKVLLFVPHCLTPHLWFSTRMGIFHYRYWHSVVPIPVLAILHFGSVPVWAQSITGTGIQWCQHWYWRFCTLVQCQYGHIPLLVLAFNCARTGIGICALWGTFHYWYWHSIVPILVLAFLHFGSVPVWARSITRTGIQWCPYQYWLFCKYPSWTVPILILNQSVKTPMPVRAPFLNASTGNGPCPYWY
jgi:hypothetical protein